MARKPKNAKVAHPAETPAPARRPAISKHAPRRSVNRPGLVREEIFEKAMILFEKKGFRGTSMRDIAESCQVSKPAIYYYFKNKSEFIKEIYNFMTSEFYQEMYRIAASDQKPAEKLETIVREQVMYSISHRRFQRILWQDRRELDAADRKSLTEQEKRYEAMLEDIIRSGQESGHFQKSDAVLTVMAILGLLASVHRWANSVRRQPEEIAAELTAFVMKSVLAG
jgi:AcrR family transcriptional regulator